MKSGDRLSASEGSHEEDVLGNHDRPSRGDRAYGAGRLSPSDSLPGSHMRPGETSRVDAPAEASGVSLTRTDGEGDRLRRRTELPGNVGRYVLVLLGSVISTAALGLWITRPSLLGEGLLVFGVLLVVLGIAQHFLLVRDRTHWPGRAYLWVDGLELVLHNGEIRAASWTDPDFAIDVYARPVRGSPNDEIHLIWKADRRIPPCQLSMEGFDRIRTAATAHGLEVVEFRDGGRKHGMRAYEIRTPRQPAAPASSGVGKDISAE